MGGGRDKTGRLVTRVKTARKRSHSSTLWLQRQLNDPYVHQAKKDGYRSRAAYKLLEIDERFNILKPGDRIIDLGAAPGGWCQVAATKTGVANSRGVIVGIDLLEMDSISDVTLLHMDFMEESAERKLREMLGGQADVVLSDMAANTTGHKRTDHLRTMGLVEAAVHFAISVLAPGGRFLAKVLQGGTEGELLMLLKQNFAVVKHVKPPASRAHSSELYVLATGFKGDNVVQSAAEDV
jgi:23S rRNA (uridine2552-2'-O)-methyltransferase